MIRYILSLSLVAGMTFMLGCAPTDIDRAYGKRRGVDGGSSVNGTAVVAAMFEESGFQVRTWRRLSPRLEQADVIVWFPDDFEPPTLDQRNHLEEWLANGTERTLVYVGRDYDAAIAYWRSVRAETPADQAMEVARRLATDQSEFDLARDSVSEAEESNWFSIRRDAPRLKIQDLSGAWSEGVEASQVEIELAARLEPPTNADTTVLLSSGDEPIVFSTTSPEWSGGKLVTVANGSFLLNLPLVNHEHRKLAGKLIAACQPGKRMILLESDAGGPGILDHDPDATYATGFEMFTVPPLGTIVLHFALLGITLCIACYPIFGRPRELKVASTSDFGQHVTALGELLERTKDRRYAVDSLRYYHEHVKKDSSAPRREMSEKGTT